MYASEPNTLMCARVAFFPAHSWNGFYFFPWLVTVQLRMYTAVFTASAHICFGRRAAFNMVLAHSTMVRLSLSAFPFCSGVYGAVCSLIIPRFLQY